MRTSTQVFASLAQRFTLFQRVVSTMPVPQEFDWIRPCPVPEEAGSHGIQVFLLALDRPDAELAELSALLSADEKERAGRFKVEPARRRFVASRAGLRIVLGSQLGGAAPDALRFIYAPQGKPSLRPENGAMGLHFNLAHSQDLALIATATDRELGVDIEANRDLQEIVGGLDRYFAESERTLLAQSGPAERINLFFQLWTRKEAVLKASGEGIASGLRLPDLANTFGRSDKTFDIAHAGSHWHLSDLRPAPGYHAALVWQIDPSIGMPK
jgi:4'-phosphopantetheinyl transferase